MALFGFGKKKEETPVVTPAAPAPHGPDAAGKVLILGSGCANCNALEAATREALLERGEDPAIEHVTDFSQIAAWGVMTTPALVVDGKLLSYGKVLKKDQVLELLKKTRG